MKMATKLATNKYYYLNINNKNNYLGINKRLAMTSLLYFVANIFLSSLGRFLWLF